MMFFMSSIIAKWKWILNFVAECAKRPNNQENNLGGFLFFIPNWLELLINSW